MMKNYPGLCLYHIFNARLCSTWDVEQTWLLLTVCFLFCFILVVFIRYLYIFCLAKPITPLCWYLLVLGYLPALHPIFNIVMYIHLCTLGWMVFLSHMNCKWSNNWMMRRPGNEFTLFSYVFCFSFSGGSSRSAGHQPERGEAFWWLWLW